MGADIVFAVTDDGTGSAAAPTTDLAGGLTGLQDRVSLLRGWIAVDSTPGGGTRIRGAVPRRSAPESLVTESPATESSAKESVPMGVGPRQAVTVGAGAPGPVGRGQA